jgi:fructokinase
VAVAIVGIGEILWDLLPTGRQPGGAPFNCAFHCHQLGHAAAVVSRVGADADGAALRAVIRNFGLSDEHVQTDDYHPTGTVTVAVDERGQPRFTITPDVAYDHLAWDEPLRSLCQQAEALCFGTLAQRHATARQTIRQALASARNALIVCDVNLRQQFYDKEVIETSLRASRWAKLNDDEIVRLRELLGLPGRGDSEALAALRRRYGLELVCLTRGERGCVIQTDDEEIAVPGEKVTVVDTVGAGDAFTAGLLTQVLEGRTLADAARFANRLAARVAASAGGTPRIDRNELGGG